jgi:hypothetical protein
MTVAAAPPSSLSAVRLREIQRPYDLLPSPDSGRQASERGWAHAYPLHDLRRDLGDLLADASARRAHTPAPRRGGRRVTDVDLTQSHGQPVSVGAIAPMLGLTPKTVGYECARGEIVGAFHFGAKREWRIPYAGAVAYIVRMRGTP